MAIKKKQETAGVVLPKNVDELSKKAFTEQFLSKKYEDEFKSTKDDLFKAIEESELEVTIGEAFKTPYGSILINETSRKKVDNDQVIELIKSKKVTLEQVLSCVSTYNNEELEKTLSKSVFDKVATITKTQSTTLKATADFKAQCEEEFRVKPDPEFVEKLEQIKTPNPPHPMLNVSSKDKLKEAMKEVKGKKAPSTKKSSKTIEQEVDDELDAILNS